MRRIAALAAAIVAVIGVTLVGARFLVGPIVEPPVGAAVLRSEAPPLQPHPASDLAAYRAEKERRLESYGWVDREHGIVRIPIERAMALYAQEQGQKQ